MFNTQKVCCSDPIIGKPSIFLNLAVTSSSIPLNPFAELIESNIVKRQIGEPNSGSNNGNNGVGNLNLGNSLGNREFYGNGFGYWVYGHNRRRGHRHRHGGGGRPHIRGRLLTPNDNCGVTRVTTSTRIVGGARAKRGKM